MAPALLLAVASGCAPASVVESGQGAFVTRTWQPPAGQRCAAAGAPPPAADAVDRAAVAWPQDVELPAGSVVLHVPGRRSPELPARAILEGVESRPLADSVHVLDTDLSAAQAERIRQAMLPHIARYQTAYLLRLDRDGGVRVSTWASVECPPLLRNREEVAQALTRVQAPQGIWTAQVDLLLDERGEVVRSLITRTSGSTAVDGELLRVAGTMRFSPALLNGLPVSLAVSLPLSLRR